MRFFLLILGIVLGVVGTIAYGMFYESAPAPVAQQMPAQAPPAQAPMTVTLDENFLTALVQRTTADAASATPGVDVPRAQVRARIEGDLIVVHAAVQVLGQPTEGTVSLRPVLRGGELAIEVVQTNLGSISLPAMDKVLGDQINSRIHSLLDGMPVTITGAQIEPGRGLTLTCQVDLDHLSNQAAAAR